MQSPRLSGQSIRRYRVERGISREELAYRAGVSIATVDRMEAGRNVPSAETIAAIARLLGVPMESLFEAA